MPFEETGAQELLDRVRRPSGRLTLSERVADAARARHIVITLGTPSFSHIEIDMRDIRSALDDLLGVLAPGHSLILRSTVAPGTTEFVAGYLAKHRGFADRRGGVRRARARADRRGPLPGGDRHAAVHHRRRRRALGRGRRASCSACFDAPIVQTTPVQAELAKIWTNILRYTTFALPNLLMMDCERYGANVFEVIDLINRDYPRGGIAQPGLTAGTCLRKDFTFSEERSAAPGMLLAVSRVNESVPLFLLEGAKRRLGSLANRKVAVLGPGVQGRHRRRARLAGAQADPAARARAGGRGRARPARGHADGVAGGGARRRRGGGGRDQPLRVPRARARWPRSPSARRRDCLVVDPWNCWGAAQVFAYASELARAGAHRAARG